MIAPDIPLAIIAGVGCAHMFYTDARWHEINPYVAGATGAAALYYSAGDGPGALLSSLGGIVIMTIIVVIIRRIRSNALGIGDFSLFAVVGAIVGIDAILPFFMISGVFGLISSLIAGQMRARKRLWSSSPMATAMIPAAFIGAIARYQYGASFGKPLSWVIT